MWTATLSTIRSRVSDNLVKPAINRISKINFNIIFQSTLVCTKLFSFLGLSNQDFFFPHMNPAHSVHN